MLGVTHTLTSAALGLTIPNPLAATGIAFLFHLFCDTLLHWNVYVEKHRWPYFWVAVDVLGGIGLTYALMGDRLLTPSVIGAVIGGNLPDVYAGIATLLKLPQDRFLRFHDRIQDETDHPFKGLLWQILFCGVAVLVMLRESGTLP